MVASITSLPEYVVPGRAAKLEFPLEESGANFVRVWVTNAPPGSEHRAKLDKSRQRRIPVFESTNGAIWDVTFDVGGRWTFVAQEYTRGASGSPGYEGAPGTAPLETPVGAEEELTFDVGQRITMPVGTGGDTATLVVWVWASTIRKTTIEHQGEISPNIIADSPTAKMKATMEATAVRDAVADLAEVTVSTAAGDVSTIVADMVENINGHHALASNVHNLADAVNIIPTSYASEMAPKDLPNFVNVALQYLRRHRTNDDGNGVDSVVIHNPPASSVVADFVNMPIVDAVSGLADAYAALADIYRCHQGHVPTAVEVFNTWHGVPSTGITYFGLNPLPTILQVHLRVFEVLASFASDAVLTQIPGAQILIEQCGGVEG